MGRLVGVLGVVLLLATGCGQHLLFRQDHRISVLTPEIYSTIRPPIVVTWATKDFRAGPDGSYAIFVDRAPMPPGATIDYFNQLDREGIFTTNSTSIRFAGLPPLLRNASAERDHHEITIVLLDPTGHRIGEEAGFVEFNLVRP